MASGEVLKEYLVSLGFKVDESSLKKWGTALGGTSGAILKFTGIVSSAAAASVLFTEIMTKQLSDLYWATQRIGSSSTNIQSYELAMKKMGGTAEQARASLEGLASNLRTSPATEAFVNALGVQTRTAAGDMRDMTLVMRDLGGEFKKMPYWIAAKWADTLGIDEDTLWKLTHGLDKFGNDYEDLYKRLGIDPERATKASKDFQNSMSNLGAVFDVIEAKLTVILLPHVRSLTEWMISALQASDRWSDKTTILGRALENVGKAAGNLTQVLKLVGLIGEVAVWLLSIMPAEALEFGVIGYFLFGKKGALVMGALGAAAKLLDKLSGDEGNVRPEYVEKAGKDKKYAASRWLYDNGLGYLNSNDFNATYEAYKNSQQNAKEGTKSNFEDVDSPRPQNPYAPAQDLSDSGTPKPQFVPFDNSHTNAPVGIRNNNPTNLRSWGNAPVNRGFAVFQDAAQGISAAAGNLQKYGERNWNTVNKIISHWAPEGVDGNATGAYIDDVSRRLGVGQNQKLDLNSSGVLQNLIKAMINHENGYNPYSDKQVAAGVNARLAMNAPGSTPARSGNKTVTINQKNDFHITGGDPKSVTKQISDELDRVNGDLVRDAKGAIF